MIGLMRSRDLPMNLVQLHPVQKVTFLHALVISPNAGQSFTVDEIVKAMSQATLKKYTNTPQHYYIRGVRAWQDHSFKCGYDSKNKEATATKIFDIQKCYDYGKES